MTFTCSNLPPSALNARIVKNGNFADYYCQPGFEMTAGTPRATCVGTNTWFPSTPPTCSVIDNTIDTPLPVWVPIVSAVLLSVVVLTCLIFLIVYCCCGAGRCCGKNKTRPGSDGYSDNGYYDDRKHYHGDSYYDGYMYRTKDGVPYVVPVNYMRKQKVPNQEYTRYVVVEPQQKTTKATSLPQKARAVPTSDAVSLVKLMNGDLVPLDKYLKTHPGAHLTTLGDRDVVYVQDPTQKTPPKQAWKSTNKRASPGPGLKSRDSTIANPVFVTVTNGFDDKDGKDKQSTNKRGSQQKQPLAVGVVVPVELVPPQSEKPSKKDTNAKELSKSDKEKSDQDKGDKTGSDLAKVKDKDSTTDRKGSSETETLTRAEYIGSGSDLEMSFDSGMYTSTPPMTTKPEFKRKAFTVRDLNRFRPAKDFPEWKPHSHPIRDNNTSTR